MTSPICCELGFVRILSVVILAMIVLSSSSPIKPGESHRGLSLGVEAGAKQLLDAQDFLTQFLSTLNLTRQTPTSTSAGAQKEPFPEYMLELYHRFANAQTAVPSANIVRSFRNEDSSPNRIRASRVQIYPLLFNISLPRHEHIAIAELRLFTLVRRAQSPDDGFICKVTIYKTDDGVVWRKEVGKEVRGWDKEEVTGMKDLKELVTQHIHAKDKSWLSFDLTHVVALWRQSGCATQRLEVHIESLRSQEKEGLVEIDIDRITGGKHNAVMVVFSDDPSRVHKQERQELSQMMRHENDPADTVLWSQQPSWEQADPNAGHSDKEELDEHSISERRSDLIYDTARRIPRNVESESCRRTPLFVDFKDIGWDTWIIHPLGYEAYKCNGVCSPPMTSEVSPTKHAIVQTWLSIKSPDRASPACCVPTKLEPISLLYKDNGIITLNHNYDGMVVAECGCR